MADGRIVIDTELNSSGAEKAVAGLGGKLNSIAKTGLKAFTGAITAAGTAVGALGAIGVKYNAEMEQYMSSFTTMLGSAEKATNHLNDLKQFAAKTPFELGDLAQASTTLQAFGTDVKDITPNLKMLGDISLGNKEKFNGLALVFGQVQSQGKLMGQDLMQMINNGFNPLQIISEKTGKSMVELKEEMSEGKISFEMVSEAMQIATSEGGKFYNAMDGQSKTLVGQWSTLKDNANALLGDMFASVSDTLKNKVLPAVNNIVEKLQESFTNGNLKESINQIAEGFANLATKLAELISEWLPKIIEGLAWVLDNSNSIAAGIVAIGTSLMVLNVAGTIMRLVEAFKGVRTATEAWAVAQKLLNIQMFANPIGLVIAAISGLVAAVIYLWNTNEGFRNFWIGVWEHIKTFFIDCWNGIIKFFTETIPSWIDSMINWLESIPKWFSELPYKLGVRLGEAIANIVKWCVNMHTLVTTEIPKIINSIVEWFGQLPGRIWTWLSSTISKVGQFAINLSSKAAEAGSSMVDNIIDAVSNLPSQMLDVGSNIVRGVWNGITGMGTWISDKVSGFFTGIVDGAKAALGIHSPSRVFRDQVGKYMAQGVGVGFEDETGNIENSIRQNLADMMAGLDVGGLTAKMTATVYHEVAKTGERASHSTINNYKTTNVGTSDNSELIEAIGELTKRPVQTRIDINGRAIADAITEDLSNNLAAKSQRQLRGRGSFALGR